MKNVYEIFDDFVNSQDGDNGKIWALRNGQKLNHRLEAVLQGAFHPKIHFVFKAKVPYKPANIPAGMSYSSLETEFDRLYLFVEGSQKVDPALSLKRKEQILIQILETLEAREAEVYMNMMLKDLKIPGLTIDIVRRAFPNLALN